MNTSSSERNPVEELAEEFLERHRRGERPALTEYTARYPELADQIRDLFPALVMMEDVRPGQGDATGDIDNRAHAAAPHKLERLGDYRILREVGHGGMGIVYEAEQESLGRHVALKVLLTHSLLDPKQLQRFQREARAAARLHHTNIVPVYGVGGHDGLHYYIMQFIQGQGLDQVLTELKRLQQLPSASGKQAGGSQPPGSGRAGEGPATAAAQALLTGQFAATALFSPGKDLMEMAEAPKAPAGLLLEGSEPQRSAPVPAVLAAHGSQADPSLATPSPSSSTVRLPGQSEHSALSHSSRQYFQSVARIGVQVADALAYAHGQGILHRDIKPSNLLLDTQGTVWVTDFGLAKATADQEDLTHTGDIVGTLRYMAPERFSGQADVRSDLYSLGLTLYELLALRPAFEEADRNKLIQQVMHSEPPRLRRLNPAAPRDLETIVLKAIARDPAQRYQTPAELADDLKRFVEDRPIQARRASTQERLWRWCRRNPVVASLTAAVAGLLVAVATVSTFSAARLNRALTKTEAAEHDARLALTKAEAAERDVRLALTKAEAAEHQARLRQAEALIGQARGTSYSRRPGQRFETLEALTKAVAIGRELKQPPEWFDPMRNVAIAALALPDIHITHSWPGFPPDSPYGSTFADLSDDFELYARTTVKGACSIRRVADDTEVARLPELGERALPVFGPGRLLCFRGHSGGEDNWFQLWDLSGPQPVLRLNDQHVNVGWSFHPGDRLLALPHLDGSIAVYDTDTGALRYRLATNVLHPNVDLHPSEPIVAVSSYHSNTFQVRDLKSGNVLVSLTLPWRGSAACAWSPDGRTLAVSEGDGGRIQLYRFDPMPLTVRLTRTMEGPSGGGTHMQFNPAGDRLAVRGWNEKVNLFNVQTGRLLFSTPRLPSSTDSNIPLRFDPSGRWLAAARLGEQQERIGLWSVADGREYRALGRAVPIEGLPAIHPGGRLAALNLSDGLALYDLETSRELAFVSVPRGAGHLCFDGAGNLLNNGVDGCIRWPVRPDPARPGWLTLGPPERLPFKPGIRQIAASRDGGVIAQSMFQSSLEAMYAGGWILSPNVPQPRRVESGTAMRWCDVSPDGRWVAFGAHVGRVNVYEAATGRRVWQSPADGHSYCRFSPDSRWLLTDNDGGRAYAVDTWEPGPRLGQGKPWDASPDSRLIILGREDGVYRLVERATGRELAQLEDPNQIAAPAVFTSDGTRLIVGAGDGLRIWDLRRIRAELAKLGLDWDAPPLPPAPPVSNVPLEIQVEMGNVDMGSLGVRQESG